MIPRRQVGRAMVVYSNVSKKYIQWKIHRNKSTSLFQITAGYNQWCPRLHHRGHTVQAIPSNTYSTSNSLNTHSTSNSLKKKRKMRWKRKWFISKEEKEGDGRESGSFQKKKRGREDKGERNNEKKARRRRRGEKDGDRGERKKKEQMRRL